MLRLTVDHTTNEVKLNIENKSLFGRSAYICQSEACLTQASKNQRLKYALEGRRIKGVAHRRQIAWPLESQLIQLISTKCTEALKTCQNTER